MPRTLWGFSLAYRAETSIDTALAETNAGAASGHLRVSIQSYYAMLQRNLLYTGVTRGKRLVVLVGQKKAVARSFVISEPET